MKNKILPIATVRTPNAVPMHCVPDGDAWRMDAAA